MGGKEGQSGLWSTGVDILHTYRRGAAFRCPDPQLNQLYRPQCNMNVWALKSRQIREPAWISALFGARQMPAPHVRSEMPRNSLSGLGYSDLCLTSSNWVG